MREIRTYGATSGDWKRSYDEWIEAPASPENGHSPLSAATAPVIDSTHNRPHHAMVAADPSIPH